MFSIIQTLLTELFQESQMSAVPRRNTPSLEVADLLVQKKRVTGALI
jgi:hypothetical protein